MVRLRKVHGILNDGGPKEMFWHLVTNKPSKHCQNTKIALASNHHYSLFHALFLNKQRCLKHPKLQFLPVFTKPLCLLAKILYRVR
jgi:hypothetical protein